MIAEFEMVKDLILFGGGLFFLESIFEAAYKGSQKVGTSFISTAFKNRNLMANDGFKLNSKTILSEKTINEHICILGPTGSGKSTSLYIPNLLSNNIRGSIIVSDPKGELYKLTSEYQKSIGRFVLQFNVLGKGASFNPLSLCKSVREYSQLAQLLLINGSLTYELQTGKKSNDVTWIQMCQSLLTASLMTQDTISKALKLILNHSIDELDQFFNRQRKEVVEQYNSFKMCIESPKTMSSIKITLSSNLSLFLDDLSINTTDFNIDDFQKKETILYISYPENKSIYLSPFMACFYSQLIDRMIDNFNEKSLPVHLFFDEFANIGQLSNITQNISTARSRKISFILCLQSLTQLKQIYGEYNTLSILNNCATKLILRGLSDVETLNYISRLCGTTEIEVMENGKTFKKLKLLFTEEELRTLNENILLCICSNRKPMLLKKDVYYKNKEYLGRI